jgi:hypothetical protein
MHEVEPALSDGITHGLFGGGHRRLQAGAV